MKTTEAQGQNTRGAGVTGGPPTLEDELRPPQLPSTVTSADPPLPPAVGAAGADVVDIDLESSDEAGSSFAENDDEEGLDGQGAGIEDEEDEDSEADNFVVEDEEPTMVDEAEESIHEDTSCPSALSHTRHPNKNTDNEEEGEEEECSGVDEYDLDDDMIEDDFYRHHHLCFSEGTTAVSVGVVQEEPTRLSGVIETPACEVRRLIPRRKVATRSDPHHPHHATVTVLNPRRKSDVQQQQQASKCG